MTAAPASAPAVPAAPAKVFRIEVRPRPGEPDPLADSVLAQARAALGDVAAVRTARVFLIQAEIDEPLVQRLAGELLADPVNQQAVIGVAPPADATDRTAIVEVHYLPGVMDPVAQSTREAIAEMLPGLSGALALRIDQIEVRTGWRYDLTFAGTAPLSDLQPQVRSFAERSLANPVIQAIHGEPFFPQRFPETSAYVLKLTSVPLLALTDEDLVRFSREKHLFLSLEEMKAVQDYFRGLPAGGREPTDVELETIAQTWSEHCVHKTLKATVHCQAAAAAVPGLRPEQIAQRPGHELHPDGSLTIHNLLKNTVAAATAKLMEEEQFRGWCVSVFKDNSGVVKFDDTDAVCIKVETHNHPSAIEPYGGAATGIGGCIRDVMGTGLAAQPIANTDVFCVAPPEGWISSDEATKRRSDEGANAEKAEAARAKNAEDGMASSPPSLRRSVAPSLLPKGILHPRRILQQIVAGVRDYGNRMGIPTVNGAVAFHPDYLGNPLVYCGCIGLIPLDKCFGAAQPGDRIIALGGRTGRDGIHGATFSSAELTDTHADEFAHAVQIGNAITQKKTLDVILQARDLPGGPLYSGITDCGAGGFSSAVGEMGRTLGATVALEQAPLKYQGLSHTEIWISEAQERMILAVPPAKVEQLKAMCAAEDVEFCDLGTFGAADAAGKPELVLTYQGTEVGRLSMDFLHDGVPMPRREATWRESDGATKRRSDGGAEPATADGSSPSSLRRFVAPSLADVLLQLFSHPNLASKHWIIRQYDHEVQGGSVVKPLVGPQQDGPSDAAVLRPKLTSTRGIALACGLQPGLGEKTPGGDSYWMALAAIDEAVRNAVCVGADPGQIAILDNFCWPRCEDPFHFGTLVRAAEACYDGALAYRTPFVSGKDSLSNQFTTEDGKLITIPPTLLITALGIVPDVARCRTMDAKAAGNLLLIVGRTDSALGGSHYLQVTGDDTRSGRIPQVDLRAGPAAARAVADLIAAGLVASAHDCSDGGLLVAAAEMAFAGRLGLDLDLDGLPAERELDDVTACFAETPSRYLLEIEPGKFSAVAKRLRQAEVPFGQLGAFADHERLTLRCPRHGRLLDVATADLRAAWLKPLDW